MYAQIGTLRTGTSLKKGMVNRHIVAHLGFVETFTYLEMA
jgi:hypothetical protein